MHATTPVNVKQLKSELMNHPDKHFVDYLCNGLQYGFDTMVKYDNIKTMECRNNLSARSQKDTVADLINKELLNGFVYGPFEKLPFDDYRVSPLGVAEGKYSFKKRLILDLSAPHNDTNFSINDLIDTDLCSMTYVKIDDAIRLITNYGKGTKLCKFDIQNAFKICPVLPNQWPLFCFKWESLYYFYVRLSFGCRSSPKIFDNISTAIFFIAEHNYKVKHILHLLDDFLTVDPPEFDAERTMALMTMIFNRLNVPLAANKTMGPLTCIEYLGIVLDTDKLEARLPANKVERICKFIISIIQKSTCTKRELLQLLGHLNFASRVIVPGRSFVSYLIKLSTKVKELHFYVNLRKEARVDLEFWLRFLHNWNGINMFYDCNYTSNFDMQLYTDASSTIGYGGYYQGKWFCSTWPKELPSLNDKSLSMAFLELYPIVVAALLWGKEWKCKKILFLCDNEATVAIVKKGRSKCIEIMKLMRQLTWCACVNNFQVTAKHIEGRKNNISDALSRLQMEKFHRLAPHAEKLPHNCPSVYEVMWC